MRVRSILYITFIFIIDDKVHTTLNNISHRCYAHMRNSRESVRRHHCHAEHAQRALINH